MKNYLNTAERDHVTMVFKLADHNAKTLNEWKGNLTAEEHKRLKTADTLILKACTSILSRVSPNDARLVRRRLDGTKIMLLPDSEFKRNLERYENESLGETCKVNIDAFCNMAGAAFMHTCADCKEKDQKSCKFREIYHTLELPFYDDEAPADRCPYDMRGVAK